MGSDAKQLWGAVGRTEVYLFMPEDLHLVDDEADTLFDRRVRLPPDEGLVQSMLLHNFIDPIDVSRRVDGKKTIVVVDDGRRRVIAAREANRRLRAQGKKGEDLIRVLARPVKGDKLHHMEVMVAQNMHRLDDTPESKAEKLKRYLEAGGDSKRARDVFKVSAETIRNLSKLANADPSVKEAVSKGMSAAAAYKVATLPQEKQREVVRRLEAEGGTKKRKGRETIKKLAKEKGTKKSVATMKKGKEIAALREWFKENGGVENYRLGHDDQKAAYSAAMRALDWVMGDDDAIGILVPTDAREKLTGT